MDVLFLGGAQVRELLPMAECIDVMAECLKTLARGDAVQPLRTATWLPDRSGLVGLMPAYLGDIDAPGMKAVTVFPGNHGTRFDSHQGVVLLFEGRHGCLEAILDASEITAIRTAAVSGLATRVLARDDASELAILGTGVQARTHLDAIRAVRPIRRVRVWSRTAENARAFVEHEQERHDGVEILTCETAREAAHGAHVACTVTSSHEPVLAGEWLSPGAHVNAVGACFAAARELDTEAVQRAEVYVDRRESAFNEAGDLLIPMQEGAFDESHVRGELGDVLLDEAPGRSSPEAITLFESLGIGVEDVAAAHHVVAKARERGVGTVLALDGSRR